MDFHHYVFFDVHRDLSRVSKRSLLFYKKQFVTLVKKKKTIHVESYVLLGIKPGMRFMLHMNANSIDETQGLLQELMHTRLGQFLEISYVLMGQTRPSQYTPPHIAEKGKAVPHHDPHCYLIIYPFTKTVEWHQLTKEKRGEMMHEHVRVGHKYVHAVKQLLLYAYGIDDHEFVVSYFTDNLNEFQSLVMDLRSTQGRAYTQNDLPIFTCLHRSLHEVLETL